MGEQLGTEIGDGCYLCRHCNTDLRESVIAHARTCPNLIPQKPLARMASVSSSTKDLAVLRPRSNEGGEFRPILAARIA